MRIGISTASLFLKYSTEEGVKLLDQLFVDEIEIFLSTYSEYSESFARTLLGNKHSNIHSIHALTLQFEPMLFSAHPLVRKDAEAILENVLRVCQIVGAKYYTFHGPAVLKRTASNFDVTKFAVRMSELADIAEKYGVTICFENTHYGLFDSPQFFATVSKIATKVCMCLDTKHALMSGYDPCEFVSVAHGKIRTVHFVDMIGNDTVLAGRGNVNFNEVISRVSQENDDVVGVIEAYSKDFCEISELVEAYEKLKQIVK